MSEYITKTEKETFDLGRAFVAQLKSGCVVALDGDLGTGKTVFVKGMAAGLGIAGHVLSPTFTLLRQYKGLNHFDVYRIDDAMELAEIGFKEYLNDENITVIEWANLIPEMLPDDRVRVELKRTKVEGQRKISIDGADVP